MARAYTAQLAATEQTEPRPAGEASKRGQMHRSPGPRGANGETSLRADGGLPCRNRTRHAPAASSSPRPRVPRPLQPFRRSILDRPCEPGSTETSSLARSTPLPRPRPSGSRPTTWTCSACAASPRTRRSSARTTTSVPASAARPRPGRVCSASPRMAAASRDRRRWGTASSARARRGAGSSARSRSRATGSMVTASQRRVSACARARSRPGAGRRRQGDVQPQRPGLDPRRRQPH